METSIFSVIGPVMVGPSSSHTAGAARLARVAGLLAGKPFRHVSFGLHGSFARTGKGHGTDRALLAGALGLAEDDERMADAFRLAEKAGVSWDFHEEELEGLHENSVRIAFTLEDGGRFEVVGSSVGGAEIRIRSIDGFETDYAAARPALILRQRDRRGVTSEVTRVLAENAINIAVMTLSRARRGDVAWCIIETDEPIGEDVAERIRGLDHILAVRAVNLGLEGA